MHKPIAKSVVIALLTLATITVLSGCSDQDSMPDKNVMKSLEKPRSMAGTNSQPSPNNPTGAPATTPK